MCLEGKILLRQITEGNNDDGGEDLGDRRIDMKLLHKELDKNIVQTETNDNQYKVPEELYAAMQRGAMEDHIAHQEKAGGKAYGKRHDERKHISRDAHKTKIDGLLVQDEIVADRIHHDVQERVRAAASRIAKSLQGHYPSERRIKEIDKSSDVFFECL